MITCLEETRDSDERSGGEPMSVPMPPEAGRLSGAAIVAGAQSAAIATDGDGRIRAWNEGARMLLGHVASRACARHFGELLEPKDVHGNPLVWPLIPFAEVVTRGEPLRPFEITVRSARGDRVPVTVSVVVVLDRASEKEELVYLLLRRYRRRRSDEIIERLLAQPEPALQARRRPDPSRAAAPKLSGRHHNYTYV